MTPYSNTDATAEILAQYLKYPVLFGGATGDGGFDALPTNFGAIQNGTITAPVSEANTVCLLYQLATQSIPSSLNSVITPTVDALTFVVTKLYPTLQNLGCPLAVT